MTHKYGYEDGKRGVEAKLCIVEDTLKIKIYGSDHGYDWLMNLKAWPRKYGFHRGWYREAELLHEFVENNFKQSEYGSVEIIGHSAGGAIGAILMFLFYQPVKVTTINAPSHGRRDRHTDAITALVHSGDIVTYLPLLYAKPERKYYGDLTWFWKAHNDMPDEWEGF